MNGTTENPAQVHLAEMHDLAERILAMDATGTLETRETGKPTVAVWTLGAELAELVRHFDPSELPTAQAFVAVVVSEDSSEVDVFERESDAHAFATATGRYVFKDEPMWHAGAETTNAYIEEARS